MQFTRGSNLNKYIYIYIYLDLDFQEICLTSIDLVFSCKSYSALYFDNLRL